MNLKKLLLILLPVVFSMGSLSQAEAANYYMSPTGKDTNPGTLGLPWRTLGKLRSVQSMLRPGDTVYFRGGNYIVTSADRHYYSLGAVGTASAPITYKNYQNEKPVLVYDWRIVPPSKTYFLFLSGSYTVFEGITIRQTEQSRSLGMVGNKEINYDRVKSAIYVGATNIKIRKCMIDNFSGVGIQTGGSTNLLVEHCIVQGTGSHAFYIAGKGGVIRYNVTDGSRGKSVQQGIQLQYKSSRGNKVYGNLMKNGQGSGVVLSGGVSDNEIFNNVIVNGGSGSASGHALGFWCEDGPIGSGNKFYNNTVIGKSNAGLVSNVLTPKCNGVRPATRVDIRDNIFYPSSAKPIGYVGASLRNNIFYNVTDSAPTGNKKVNPLLVNPLSTTAASAMIKSGSPAINAGLSSLYPKTDYRGYARPAKYDIGAFEFGAVSP
ncbi:MAG: hypothetical protein A4S09_16095 [Proteobacteria bacterium SG_bin7]|nr:MAG: hypothetical protein A4S09_16095 [Proteobacteria bacterium SG_bin7]